jgi:hypothetical protein
VFDIAIAWRLIRDEARPMGARIGRLMVFGAAPLVSAIWWLGFFYAVYGTPNPAAPYGDTSVAAGTHWQYVPAGFVALFFDGQFGLLTYAPVLAAAVIGWWRPMDRAMWRVGQELLIATVLYCAAVATYWMWWAGNPAPPARFFAAMLPALAVPVATAWATGGARRRAGLAALLAVSLAITAVVIGVNHGALAWNDRDAQSQLLQWLGPLVNLRRGWPSFFWTLAPDFNLNHLGSEWLFARHVGVWVLCWVAVWIGWLVIRSWNTDVRPIGHRLAAAAFVLTGLLVSVQAGWWLNGVTGLDPQQAQVVVVRSGLTEHAALRIGTLSVRHVSGVAGDVELGTEEPGKITDPPPWFIASRLPAGDYDVHLHLAEPHGGTLAIAIGDATTDHSVAPAVDQSWPIRVGKDGSDVTMMPDDALRSARGTVVVIPK